MSLIEGGTNFNERSGAERKTPIELMLASDMKDEEKRAVVTKLNSIFRRDPTGGTPLHETRDFETARKLIGLGANPLETDAKGYNFLHAAADRPDLGLIQGILADKSIDARQKATLLTTRDDSGQRPLDVLASKDFSNSLFRDELELISKHIGGILRDKGLAESTDLWQDLTDAFQKFCKAVGIKTERMEVLEKIENLEKVNAGLEYEPFATSLKAALEKSPQDRVIPSSAAAAARETINPVRVDPEPQRNPEPSPPVASTLNPMHAARLGREGRGR